MFQVWSGGFDNFFFLFFFCSNALAKDMTGHKSKIQRISKIHQDFISKFMYSSVFFNRRDLNRCIFIWSNKEHQYSH